MSRRHAATWQPGNLLQLRWVGRLADQLGSLTAELVHPAAARAMDDPLALTMLMAICATADGALPEREPHPRSFGLLIRLVASLADPLFALPLLVQWEAALLTDLGYGLDLSACAVSGSNADLAFVSPRTGRAVAAEAAGPWRNRLLKLPAFLVSDASAGLPDVLDGLKLTGHFLARDAFGAQNRPLPPVRVALYDRIVRVTFPDSPHSPELLDSKDPTDG
jgi:DNA repair protein RecO (recombination protein O)